MTLSTSSSVSSLRSATGHNFPSTRLAPIEESKYEKHRQQQEKEDQRRICLLVVLVLMALGGLWHLFVTTGRQSSYHEYQYQHQHPSHHHHHYQYRSAASASASSEGESLDDQVIQSLRRNPPRHHQNHHAGQDIAVPIPKENHGTNGGVFQQQQQQQRHQQHVQQPEHPIHPDDTKSREERLEHAIQELKKYQADAGSREREYQNEVKAQLEDELKKS